MRRSGHNAISRFLYDLYDKPKAMIGGNGCHICSNEKKRKYFESLDLYRPEFYNPHDFGKIIKRKDDMELILMKSENVSLSDRFYSNNIVHWDTSVGHCNNVTFVLCLRDPFNCLSSIFFHKALRAKLINNIKTSSRGVKLGGRITRIVTRWKQHAREFIGETGFLSQKKIFVNYNKWIKEQFYREQIANSLGVAFNDKGWYVLTPEGGGSSFDQNKVEDIRNLEIFERWRVSLKDKVFFEALKIIFKDAELVKLSEKIFGHIEGTEIFYE